MAAIAFTRGFVQIRLAYARAMARCSGSLWTATGRILSLFLNCEVIRARKATRVTKVTLVRLELLVKTVKTV